MRCLTGRSVDAVHVEIFVNRRCCCCPRESGCGRRCGARASRGCAAGSARIRCTRSIPTGTVFVDRARQRMLGDLFAVWGQRLAPRRLLSFTGRVRVFRNGREWRGDPRQVPLARHDSIVLEIGGYVKPHARYLFPEGQ